MFFGKVFISQRITERYYPSSAKHNGSASCGGRFRIHPSTAGKSSFREAHDLRKFL